MPDDKAEPQWRTYEQVAQYLLSQIASEFGLGKVEGKQIVPGKSGTEWEIDAKGVRLGDDGFVLIECRRHSDRLSQGAVAEIAYQIHDTGASGGIVVSPLDLQSGAQVVADHENIAHVILSPESSTTEYLLHFMNKIFVGLSDTIRPVGDLAEVRLTTASCNRGDHALCTNAQCSCECHKQVQQ